MKEFASADLTMGQLNALVKKIGGRDNVLRVLRDELTLSEVVRSWSEEDNIIRFSVVSDGTSGANWIKRLEDAGHDVCTYSKQVLLSPDFQPTFGVTIDIVVMKGTLFLNDERITRNIRAEAVGRRYVAPNLEVAYLISEKFTERQIMQMGLWGIVTMHEPITDSAGNPSLLYAHCNGKSLSLSARNDSPFPWWDDGEGFAFAVLAI